MYQMPRVSVDSCWLEQQSAIAGCAKSGDGVFFMLTYITYQSLIRNGGCEELLVSEQAKGRFAFLQIMHLSGSMA